MHSNDLDKLLAGLHEGDRERVNTALQQLRTNYHDTCEIEFRTHATGTHTRWFKLYGKTFPAQGKTAPRTIGVVQDVTERRQADECLRQAATVFERTSEAIVILDSERRVDTVNAAYGAITGFNAEETLGYEALLLSAIHQEPALYNALWSAVETNGQWQGEVRAFRKNGERFDTWLSICRVSDALEGSSHYVVVFSDISMLRRAEAELSRLAHYDTLTSLPNRLLTMDRLNQALERARRRDLQVAVLFIDLDNFKRVNDSLGHQAGDELLRTVAARFQECLRTTDVLGRLGGDEFVVILDQPGAIDEVAVVAHKLINALTKPLSVAGRDLTASASIGISLFPFDAALRDDLIRTADTAMFAAKESGRNRYAFYSPEMTVRAAHYLAREQELRHALAHGELVLHYQPQVNLPDARIIGVEALIRWQHPERGLLGAAEVIPTAEESGLIVEIGEWVLSESCRQARAWLDAGLPPLRISINISVKQISTGRLPALVTRLLNEHQLEARWLELEITESTLQNEESCIATLRELRRRGVSTAIDDFGTGYSCLSSLKLLPIQRIKIDQAFVRDISSDPNDRVIAAAIMAIGHQLQLRIIAEGVETQTQADFLCSQGCDEAQGYFYSQPVAAADIPALLQRGALAS